MKLKNKIAVITGGNSGIGLATAQRFAAEGAQVVITGRRQKELDEAVKTIGHGAVGIAGDVSKNADLDALYATIKQKFGHIDVLFANAGHGKVVPTPNVTEEHFVSEMSTNVKGVYFTVQKALPLLKDGASVILTGSVISIKGMAGFSVYNATKAAVRSFARTWANELRQQKIRVNVLSPGPIETPIFGKMGLTKEQQDGFGSAVTGMVPLGRFGKPEEIASAAVFLASDESSYVNGIELFVDGGMGQV
jgi:NAD(P)-dependent dehydrogenase (short-subunit alcohol dehydrogenase family)